MLLQTIIRTGNGVFQLIALSLGVAVLLAPAPVIGQLTSEDIARLREQGEREGWTFVVGENAATGYSLDQLCGLKEPENWRLSATFDDLSVTRTLPEAFDWRQASNLPPIRNQGGCGSCWAFATIGALECNINILDGVAEDLSEQWLVSCNHSGWSCDGGWFAHDYHWWMTDECDSTGAVLEADFPYDAWDAPCSCPDPHPYHIESWAYIGTSYGIPSIAQIKQAIMEYGPVSVAVAVNGAFQGYNSGVFNGCSGSQLNHAVVLVGWDDNQGPDGVWFLRNSWGPGWGEDGYMRIPYNCSMVGYAACYVNYEGGVSFSADTTIGWAPFDVSFAGTSGLDVDTWTWDFRDGDSAFVQSPTHTFQEGGLYSVKVEVDAGGMIRTREKPDYVKVLADSLMAADAGGVSNSSVEVEVYARNFVPLQTLVIPVKYAGSLDAMFDSFSTVGCRTNYFETQQYIHFHPDGKELTIRLISSSSGTAPDLPAGEGSIAKLYFTLPFSLTYGLTAAIVIDGYGAYQPYFSGQYATYQPRISPGSLTLLLAHGDMDGAPGINISDLTFLIDYLFRSGPDPLPVMESGDANCDNYVNIADLTFLVDHLFRAGPPPPLCP